MLALAKYMWTEGKSNPKTRSWFQRAVKVDADFGDAWAYLYKFELIHGNEVGLVTVHLFILILTV